VIAATNRDLEEDIRSGRFRADIYYRLSVFHIHIPPLRERREDIRPLVEHFLDLRQQETGKQGLRLSDEAWALLLGYHWPGNVREVESWSHRLAPLAGTMSHQSSIATGIRQHFFTGATSTLPVGTGEILYAWAYLDSANMPSQIMLQWNDGASWEHRAYWGANNIGGRQCQHVCRFRAYRLNHLLLSSEGL